LVKIVNYGIQFQMAKL